MQDVHATLLTRLQQSVLDPATERKPCDLYEVYAHDYIPDPVNGFEPADALEKFSAIDITWNGIAYRREVVSRGSIDKQLGQQINTVSVTFSAVSGYLPTWAIDNDVEGMWMVIRYVERDITAGSIVLFAGKCRKPGTINDRTFQISIAQEAVDPNAELPLRSFTAQDPEGRSPTDDEYEGIRLVAVAGSQTTPQIIPAQNRFARLIGQRDTVDVTRQWSSLDNTPYGDPVPEVLGRAQMKLKPFFWADKGLFVAYLMAGPAGPIAGMSDIKSRTSGFSDPFNLPGPVGPIIHLGDRGGTGTNLGNTNQFQESGKFSHLAYIEGASTGSAADVEDAPPEVTALVKGRRVPVPDSSGIYTSIDDEASLEWSDNPVDLARWVFIESGLDENFLEDAVNYQTRLWCDEPLLDESNSSRVFIPSVDIPQTGGPITRYIPTGFINPRSIRFQLGEPVADPTIEQAPYEPLDLDDIPGVFTIERFYRKRYTFNAPIMERIKATNFLFKILYPSARLYDVVNSKGEIEIRSEKAADRCLLRASTSPGATAILVDDVTQWKTGALLKGYVHIGFGLTTSENRRVSSATYSLAGNTITISAASTGIGVAVPGGGFLSGGSSTVQASGTVVLTGSPAAGATVTATLNGIAVLYTLAGDDTLTSAAAMLAVAINADTRLNRFISATSSGAVVTIKAKYGELNLSSALILAHTGPRAAPIVPPVLASSAGTLLPAGTYLVAYAYVTAMGKTTTGTPVSITIAANKKIDVSSLGGLPVGVLSVNWYVSESPGSDKLLYYGNNNGGAFSITSLPSKGNPGVPPFNSSGEEAIRIAMPFATNTQGPTVLAQAGLTKGNIKGRTYNFPLGSEQSSVNQIKGKFRDAANDFALTPFTVSDKAHYARVHKWTPLEVDFSGVDNWHQAFRLANAALAKNREGDWFDTHVTGNGEALLLEEGDLKTASDVSAGLINVLTRIEALSISPTHEVTIRRARRYSTEMFSDDVRQRDIPLASTLRYVQTRQTILRMVNGPPVKDADGQVPGAYAFASYDDDINGDWRGASLYADYGEGYQELADFDLLATVGVCTTTLATATSPGWDRTNSLTVQLYRGELSSKTDGELAADPRVNLAAVGNEYIRFKTVVDNGGGSYTLSDLLRGEFGTNDRMSHGADEAFCLFDGAEKFVPLDPVHLNVSYPYKGVTRNRDVADADVYNFTWNGGTALPLPVDGLRVRLGNFFVWYFSWNRVARFGQGMRGSAGVPLSEEEEIYQAEVYNGATLGRGPQRLKGHPVWPVLWVKAYMEGTQGWLVPDRDGTAFSGPLGNGFRAVFESVQQVRGDFFFEVTMAGSGNRLLKVGLAGVTNRFLAGQTFNPTFYLEGLSATSISAEGIETITVAPGDRVAMRVRGTVVEYFLNYHGENSVPFYRSLVAYNTQKPQKIVFEKPADSNLYVIISPRITDRTASFVYSDGEAIQDFGSLPSSITLKVYQESGTVGRGPAKEIST